MNRLIIKHLWFCCYWDDSPHYLYWNDEFEMFDIGNRSQARKYKWEFTDEELEQIKKDYDVDTYFITVKEGRSNGKEEKTKDN